MSRRTAPAAPDVVVVHFVYPGGWFLPVYFALRTIEGSTDEQLLDLLVERTMDALERDKRPPSEPMKCERWVIHIGHADTISDHGDHTGVSGERSDSTPKDVVDGLRAVYALAQMAESRTPSTVRTARHHGRDDAANAAPPRPYYKRLLLHDKVRRAYYQGRTDPDAQEAGRKRATA